MSPARTARPARRRAGRDDPAEQRRLARKARRREGRREAILDAAREVLLETGLEGFTVGAVAEAADLSKPAVFYYFESKEEIIAALAGRTLRGEADALLAAVKGAEDGVEALQALVRSYVAYHQRDLQAFRLFQAWSSATGVQRRLLETDVYPASARVNEALEARLRRDRRAGRLDPDAHPRRLANLAYVTAHGLVSLVSGIEGMGGDMRFGLDALCEEACSLLERGARKR